MTEHHKKTAETYFEHYPKEQVLHIASDGQVFLNSGHNDAVNHQASLTKDEPEAKLVTISRKSLTEPEASEEEKEESELGKEQEGSDDQGTGDDATEEKSKRKGKK